MKKRMIVSETIAVLFVLWSIIPVSNVSGLEKSTTAAVSLIDGVPYFLGSADGDLYIELESQLWRTDGTSTGTILLSTADPLGPHFNYQVGFPFYPKHYPKGTGTGGLFFFSANDGSHGYELWRSNGTPAGTFLVKDIVPGSGSSFPENLIAVSNLVYFTISADDYSSPGELWRSDGTPEGTFMLTSVSTAIPYPNMMAAGVNGLFLFQKIENGGEIWRSDGTTAGTSEWMTGVKAMLEVAKDRLFFTTTDNLLWATDGSTSGTVTLTDFPVIFHGCVNGACYFSEDTSAGPEGFWMTDGTPAGTLKLAAMNTAGWELEPVDVNGTIYFTVGDELWKTNNTPAGTLFVTDNLSISQLASAYNQLFFINSGQLWKSGGTAAGTVMVAGFENGQKLSKIVVSNGKLLLKIEGPICYEYQCNQEWHLYTSDGTQVGTRLVADFAQTLLNCPTPLCSAGSLFFRSSTVVDGMWFFDALDTVTHTSHLWVVADVFFRDVFPNHWAFAWVERLAEAGITGGCNLEHYCPDSPVTRGQMAVFLEKGLYYPDAFTPQNLEPTFNDTLGHWAEDWIEALKNDGITAGCGDGNYCPEDPVTRAQMAVFLLKAKHGASYIPPAVGTDTGFGDVSIDHWAAAWIKQLAAESITGGCGGGNYCPDTSVTRAQMAVFLVKTFNLP